jgi:photosystem II stability/assembly factor-like uncharacterized protein
MRAMRTLFLFLLFVSSARAQWWKVETSGIDTNLRGLSAVYVQDAKGVRAPVVWASGSNGVILRSLDEGQTWQRLRVTGGDALDFRGIVALNATIAYVMSSGEGEKSHIYKTTDGGETWTLQYTDKRKEFFLDALKCVTEWECVALGDPIDGKFLLLRTEDGQHWNPLPSDKMPKALPGEGAFAASNSSLLFGGPEILFGTGGGTVARIFHSNDSGRTWTAVETPMAARNSSAGIFSLARDFKKIFAVGGDYKDPNRSSRSAAYSADDGKTWRLVAQSPGGYRSGVAWVRDDPTLWVVVGPNGEDVSKDSGLRWKHTDSLNLNAVVILDIWDGWAVGPHGTIARFVNQRGYLIHNLDPQCPPTSAASLVADYPQKACSPGLKKHSYFEFLYRLAPSS